MQHQGRSIQLRAPSQVGVHALGLGLSEQGEEELVRGAGCGAHEGAALLVHDVQQGDEPEGASAVQAHAWESHAWESGSVGEMLRVTGKSGKELLLGTVLDNNGAVWPPSCLRASARWAGVNCGMPWRKTSGTALQAADIQCVAHTNIRSAKR